MVPSGWKWTNLGTLANKVGSGVTPKGGSNSYKNSGIPLIRSQNVLWGTLNLKDVAFIDDSQHQKMKGSIVYKGDVLLNITGASIGRVAVSNLDEANVNQHVCIIRSDKLDPEFLRDFLLSFNGQKQIEQFQAGGNRQGLNFEQIKSFKLPVPPLLEQSKIAKILSTWNKSISNTERLIDNSKQQRKALMQQLLTGKKRLFDDSGNPFKGEWKHVHLEDTCLVNPKKPAKPDNGLVSFVPMDGVSEDTKLIRHEVKLFDDVSKGFTSFVNQDCLVAKITPCFENGKGAYVDNLCNGIGFGSTEFHVLRAKDGNSAKFIYYITQTREFRVRGEMNMQGSAGQKRVTTDYLKLFKVNIPPTLVEQQKIASVLTNADKEIGVLEQQLADLRQEKKALMQQLLTGKRRVKVN